MAISFFIFVWSNISLSLEGDLALKTCFMLIFKRSSPVVDLNIKWQNIWTFLKRYDCHFRHIYTERSDINFWWFVGNSFCHSYWITAMITERFRFHFRFSHCKCTLSRRSFFITYFFFWNSAIIWYLMKSNEELNRKLNYLVEWRRWFCECCFDGTSRSVCGTWRRRRSHVDDRTL